MLFIFVWRRNGAAVPFITIGSLILFNFIYGESYSEHVMPKVFAFLVAAAAIFAISRFTEEEGDHFFFVPLKYWAPIIAIGGTIIAVSLGETPAKPAEAPPQPAAQSQPQPVQPPTTYQPPPVQPVAAAPAPRPQPQAAPVPQEEEPVKLSQVWVDPATKLYYPEGCKGRPDTATKLAKSVAVMQGYKLAPGCGS